MDARLVERTGNARPEMAGLGPGIPISTVSTYNAVELVLILLKRGLAARDAIVPWLNGCNRGS